MGSFNTTCFASQQTIAPGDPCVVIPLFRNAAHTPLSGRHAAVTFALQGLGDSNCYVNAYWRPCAPLMAAKYADYGRVRFDDTLDNRQAFVYFLCWILRQGVKVEQGENQYHDVPFDLPAFMSQSAPELLSMLSPAVTGKPRHDWSDGKLFAQCVASMDYIWEVAHAHRLFALRMADAQPVQFGVLHRAAHDELIERVSKLTGWHDAPLEQHALIGRMLAEVDKEFEREVDLTDERTVRIFQQAGREHLHSVGSGGVHTIPNEGLALNAIAVPYRDKRLDAAGVHSLLKPSMDMRYVLMGLEMLNLKLSPMVYASQDYDNEIGREYASFVQATCVKVTAGR